MFHSPVGESKDRAAPSRTIIPPEPPLKVHSRLADPAALPRPAQLSQLQRTIGNRAVMRSLSPSTLKIQAKLTLNQPGDHYEREADQVADQIMRMEAGPSVRLSNVSTAAAPIVHRRCTCGGLCSECQDEPSGEMEQAIQRKHLAGMPAENTEAPSIVHEVLRSDGHPLDASTRAFMEPRFGRDLSAVRVHTGDQAARSARAINARAYASGPHVVFGSGQPAAGSMQSRKLLAHELSHVVQQGYGGSSRNSAVVDGAGGLVQRSPLDYQGENLTDLIKQLEFDLIDARYGADKQKRQIVATEGIGYFNRYSRASTTKRIYNIQERLSAVRLQQASPKNQRTLYDVKVVAIEFGDTVGGKTLTGNKLKSLQNSYGGFPRTFDNLAYVEGANGEVLGAQPVELKSEGAQTENSLLAKSVKGGINQGDIESNYRPASTIAKQVEKTTTLSQAAAEAEGWLVLRGRDAITDQEVTIRVRPGLLTPERITSYGRLPDVVTVPVPKGGPSGSGTESTVPSQVKSSKKPGGGSGGSSGGAPATSASPQPDPVPETNSPERKTTAEVGIPLEAVVEATPGLNVEASAGVGGAVQLIQALQIGSLQSDERAKAVARLEELQPKIDAYLAAGNSVRLVLVVEKPNTFDFGCASGVFCDQGDLVYFRELYIDYVESDRPAVFHAPSPNDPPSISATHVLHDSGSRSGFIPTVSQGGSLTEDWEIRSGTAKHANHVLASVKTVLSPPVSFSFSPANFASTPSRPKPVKPKPSSPEIQKVLAAAPSKVYLLSGNIQQYATGQRLEPAIATAGVFLIVGRATAGVGTSARTAVIYWNNLDQPRAELLAAILRSAGLPLAHTESGGPGDRDPGDLQINFGRDAER
jgi:hypothetical protein